MNYLVMGETTFRNDTHQAPRPMLCHACTLQAAVEPFPGYNIHLVNEAYGNPGAWLEASLYRRVKDTNHECQ